MKSLVKFLPKAYHLLFVSGNRACRYDPTCSQYLIDAVEKYGAFKGLYLGLVRILSCHPYSRRPLYDPA